MTNYKVLTSILFVSILAFGCSSDDDNSDPLANLPSSDIVAFELRDTALSGTVASSGRAAAIGQKWWSQLVSKVTFSGECGEEEDQEITDGYYYAFYPSGQYYAKNGKAGAPISVGNWQWVNNTTKDAIYVSGIEFKLRGLNETELIIASDQSQASCTIVTWDQFNNPYTE